MIADVRTDFAKLMAEAKRLANEHNWSNAADTCSKARDLAPNDIATLGELGWYLSRAKRYDEAIEVFKVLSLKEPAMAKWPYMIGYQYYDQQNWREAVHWFDKALEIRPTYIVVLYRKGYAHTQLEETDVAREAFEKCVNVWRSLSDDEKERESKNYSDACFQLGKILLTLRQTRKAEVHLAEAVKYDSSDAYKYYNFGKALLENGKPREALEQFQIADRIEPNKDYILVYIARAHMTLQEYSLAEARLESIPSKRRKHFVWSEIGELRLRQNQPKNAKSALLEATNLDPKNHNYFYRLGMAYQACNEIPAAHRAFTRAIDLRQRNYNLEFPEATERLVALKEYAASSRIEIDSATSVTTSPDGFIKTFKPDRGFGFISRANESDVFFHISEVANPDAIAIGAGVSFELKESPKGLQAIKIKVI